MDPREQFDQFAKPRLGAYVFSMLFLLTGVFSLRGDLLGKTLASFALLHTEEEETEPIILTDGSPVPAALIEEVRHNPQRLEILAPEPLNLDRETLWLARCIYSETKRLPEQELVAWVVRNRVETGYRGKKSYRDVVLDPYQFSAFNPESRKRGFYSNLTPDSKSPGWKNALRMAMLVRNAEAQARPFSNKTRHFYSERSMVGRLHPRWAEGLQPVKPMAPVQLDEKRFRFFENIR